MTRLSLTSFSDNNDDDDEDTATNHSTSTTSTFLTTTPPPIVTAEQCDDQLAHHIQNQQWENVSQVLQRMQTAGFPQTNQTFHKCLQACTTTVNNNTTTTTDTTLLLEVWNAFSETVAPTCDHVEYLLRHCISYSEQQDAWTLLRQSPTTYNDALQILSHQGQWKTVLREWKRSTVSSHSTTTTTTETYRAMWNVCLRAADCPMEALLPVLQAASPTTRDIQDILTTACRRSSWRNAMILWEFFKHQQLSLPCYHALLFHRHIPLATAQHLLRELQQQHLQPVIETYNRVMYLAQRHNNLPVVMQLLQELQQKYNLQPNVVTYTHVLRACLADRQWNKALTVFQVARDKLASHELDVYLYTAAMEAAVKSKQSARALELLHDMQHVGIVPNSFTYRVAMLAAPHRALEFLNALKSQQQQSSETTTSTTNIPLITYNAALQALAQTAKHQAKLQQSEHDLNTTNSTTTTTPIWQHAVELLNEIKQQQLQPDGFTYNAVIMCCCHGPWESALYYIQEMQDSSLPPNRLVYTAAIASCGKHGQADHALQLLAQMKQYKIPLDIVTYNAVLTALRVAQQPAAALELWNELILLEQDTTTQSLSRLVVGDRHKKRQYSTGKTALIPDMITITEVIGALTTTGTNNDATGEENHQARIDDILAYAVERKLLLNGFLDSSNEFNLSGLTFPVARAACRYLLQRYQPINQCDLTLITGVGKQQLNKTSLRDYLQEWLETEFNVKTSIPRLAQGTIVISCESLLKRAVQ